jgi:hypothetical protein
MKQTFSILANVILSIFLLASAGAPVPFTAPARAASPAMATAAANRSIEFSGFDPTVKPNNSYVEVPHSTALNPDGGEMTIEVWVKPADTTGCQTLVGNDWTVSYWLGLCDGHIRFYPHGSGSALDGSQVIPAGAWSHIAVTYNGVFRNYYINDALVLHSGDNPGKLTPSGAATPLEIGADVSGGYYFNGRMQELRIWNVVRTAQQIWEGFYQGTGTAPDGLVAEWPFAGDTFDYISKLEATPRDKAVYSIDSARLRRLELNELSATPTLDGSCDPAAEYAGAEQLMLGYATAYLLHTSTDLWVCLANLTDPDPSVTDTYAALYLDLDYLRSSYSTSARIYALQLHSWGTMKSASRFSFSGGWTAASLPVTDWDGLMTGGGEAGPLQAEFRVASGFIGGWNRVAGLSLAQHAIHTASDSIFWPFQTNRNNFATWGTAVLYGPKLNYTFSGQVRYLSQVAGVSSPVPGQAVRLYGTPPGGGDVLVGQAESDLNGNFNLSSSDNYTTHTLRQDPTGLPRGTVMGNATSTTGTVTGASITFRGSPAGTYTGNTLNLRDPAPTPLQNSGGPYFLIIAKDSMTTALQNFVNYKTRLGFDVEVVTTEWINAHMSGANISEKVRNLELNRRSSIGSRFQYLLLVGSNNTIPVRRFSVYAKSQAECIADPGEPTDWYYADLTDNFDSNGNGCLADGIWTIESNLETGYTPDSGITFSSALSLGRLPFESADLLTRYLNSAMSFEQSTTDYKKRALLAGSMFILHGRCWWPQNTPASMGGQWYLYEQDKCDLVWGDRNPNDDASVMMERIRNQVLIPTGFTTITTLYENEHPATGHSPAINISPQPLTRPNFFTALEGVDYGLVGLAGHGDAGGIARTTWSRDPNGNDIIESHGGPDSYLDERGGGDFIRVEFLPSPRSSARKPGIFFAEACSTLRFDVVDTLGARLLSNGFAVGYVGALHDGRIGGEELYSTMAEQILVRSQRMGDAFWNTTRYYFTRPVNHLNPLILDLFGDPTLSYWGNPGQQALNASWAMQRSEPLGSGSSNLTGPTVASLKWTYSGSAPLASGLKPSPVVSSTGEVLVADGSYLDVVMDGAAYQRLALDHNAYGSPAVASDGTAYVLDTAGDLYAFRYPTPIPVCFRSGCTTDSSSYDFSAPYRSRHWKLNLGGDPLSSPVIGSDGYIFVATRNGATCTIFAIRPDGTLLGYSDASAQPTGGLAVSADRKVFYTTLNGRMARVDFFSGFLPASFSVVTNNLYSGTAYATPPSIHNGWVYASLSDGRIMKTKASDFTGTTAVSLDSTITAGPSFDTNGNLIVGTQNGTLYSLDPDDFSSNWTRSLGSAITGIPATSSNGIYVVNGSMLRAFDPNSGNPQWNLGMGSSVTGSTAVGYGRELYVQLSNGQVRAVSEGWQHTPWLMLATTFLVAPATPAIRIRWSYLPPAAPGGTTNDLQAVFAADMPAQYLLQRSEDGADWTDVAILDAGVDPQAILTYDDTEIQPGRLYAYRLQSLDPSGQGLDSDFLTAYAQASLPGLPATPKLLGVTTVSSTSLQVEFEPQSGDATAFRIERGPASTGPFTAVATVTNAAGGLFTDQGLAPNSTYHYRIIATNDTGENDPSNVLSGKTYANSLAAPANVHASAGTHNTITVTWTPGASGVTAVIEVEGFGVASFSQVGTTTAQAGTFTFNAGSPSSYAIRVKFVKAPAESAYTDADLRVSTGPFDSWMNQQEIYLPLIRR